MHEALFNVSNVIFIEHLHLHIFQHQVFLKFIIGLENHTKFTYFLNVQNFISHCKHQTYQGLNPFQINSYEFAPFFGTLKNFETLLKTFKCTIHRDFFLLSKSYLAQSSMVNAQILHFDPYDLGVICLIGAEIWKNVRLNIEPHINMLDPQFLAFFYTLYAFNCFFANGEG